MSLDLWPSPLSRMLLERSVSIILEQEFIYSDAYKALINLLSRNLNRNEKALGQIEKTRKNFETVHLVLFSVISLITTASFPNEDYSTVR